MAIEYREDRGCWTFRVYRHGKRHKRYGFKTKQEAQSAEKKFLAQVELGQAPTFPRTSLQGIATEFLLRTLKLRSKSRYQGVAYNFDRTILPYFGAAVVIDKITPEWVEEFVADQLKRVQPMTVWHYVKDLRAVLNWAIRQDLLLKNPVDRADLGALAFRFNPKPPLNLADVERAAGALTGLELLYFDVLRFMGLRREEGNRIQAKDFQLVNKTLWLTVHGTKTAKSHRVLPVPPPLRARLRSRVRCSAPTDYLFGRPAKWNRRCIEGGPIPVYDRRKMFQRIHKTTGVKLKPKDLRDYFASVMKDPLVASKMLGHTSLDTTAIYTRQVQERMVAGVKDLGAKSGGQFPASTPVNTGHSGVNPSS